MKTANAGDLPASCLVEQQDGTLSLTVHVQPRASRTRLCGLHGNAVKLGITAPPLDGRANDMVIEFLARLFRLPKSALTIKTGHQSRAKILTIRTLSLQEAAGILELALRK
ncbi:MAG: hypothetical protein A2521_10465 [Deltaproteobacteria bacterium RIFOXYD12_FULL_57_12]|nr:MAG: hypothetical protein A2521_10465 [Deltaproteobacteria bacterium RIFOXYD12_FULL_57_12]